MAGTRLPKSLSVAPNLTPMIDVVFQLFIFFLLVAQFSAQRTIELQLPRLAGDERDDASAATREVINVVPTERTVELGGDYRLAGRSYMNTDDGIVRLTEALRESAQRNPGAKVLVRASRTERYERVHPVLDAASRAGLAQVELVTAPPAGAAPVTNGEGLP